MSSTNIFGEGPASEPAVYSLTFYGPAQYSKHLSDLYYSHNNESIVKIIEVEIIYSNIASNQVLSQACIKNYYKILSLYIIICLYHIIMHTPILCIFI